MKYRTKVEIVTAYRLSPVNIGQIAGWCGGNIKGLRLPEEKRCIDFFDKHRDIEVRVEMGDWIVLHNNGALEAMDDETFHERYDVADDLK